MVAVVPIFDGVAQSPLKKIIGMKINWKREREASPAQTIDGHPTNQRPPDSSRQAPPFDMQTLT